MRSKLASSYKLICNTFEISISFTETSTTKVNNIHVFTKRLRYKNLRYQSKNSQKHPGHIYKSNEYWEIRTSGISEVGSGAMEE